MRFFCNIVGFVSFNKQYIGTKRIRAVVGLFGCTAYDKVIVSEDETENMMTGDRRW